MIDVARLVALRSRYSELRADYQRRGADLRAATSQLARDRSAMLAAHPELADRLDEMSAEELKAAGISSTAMVTLRATETALARKRRAHEQLGSRIRVWSSYMESIERLAAEHGA